MICSWPSSLPGVPSTTQKSKQQAINGHGFADDTKIYGKLGVKDTAMRNFQVNTMANCIASVRSWKTVKKLKLKNENTEIMMVDGSHNQCRLRDISIKIGEAKVTPKPNVKALVLFKTLY